MRIHLDYLLYLFNDILLFKIYIAYVFSDSSDIHLPDKSPGNRVEQIATTDVPLQNGGTKTQEENLDPSKFVRFYIFNYIIRRVYTKKVFLFKTKICNIIFTCVVAQ